MNKRILYLLFAMVPVIAWARMAEGGMAAGMSWAVADGDTCEIVDNEEPEVVEEVLPDDGVEGIPTVHGIRQFRNLPVGTEARLVMHGDTVMFVSDNDIYLRGDAAICLRGSKFNLERGMVLTGTLIGVRGEDDGMPLMLPSEHTTDQYYECTVTCDFIDHVFTFDDLMDKVADVVTVEDVVVDSLADESGARCLFATKNGRRMPVVDYYGVSSKSLSVPAKCQSMQSILAVKGESFFLIPVDDLSLITVPSEVVGISDCRLLKDKFYFDLQGRRLKEAPQKGVYIEDGRKKAVH